MFFRRKISAEELAELTRERERADRLYNDALTELDRAIVRVPEMPHPPPPPDEHQITPLNRLWTILPDDLASFASGWGGRLRMAVWRMVGPMLHRQQEFNAALVDHVNRNVGPAREAARAGASTLAVLGEQLEAVVAFQSRLLQYLQQITLYVDTKDREYLGYLEHRTIGLAAGLAGTSDDVRKRWESMLARERRYEATAVHAIAELDASVTTLQRTAQSLKREIERLAGAATPGDRRPAGRSAGASRRVQGGARPEAGAERDADGTLDGSLDSYKYVGFEDRFRGPEARVRAGLADYAARFAGASDVIDLGCGRGELLDVLRERGITARGVDVNREMVAVCRERGLDVEQGDALAFLLALPDESLGGLVAAQVVEHLEPDYLVRLLGAAYHKLRPGSTIVLETINPACWLAFFESYIRDITHVRPIHPDTLSYLLSASGFSGVAVELRSPVAAHTKLQRVPVPTRTPDSSPDLALIESMAETINANVDRMNGLLFSYLDYTATGTR